MAETVRKSILDPTRYFDVIEDTENDQVLTYHREARELAGNANNDPEAVGNMMSRFAKAVLVKSGLVTNDADLITQGREIMLDLASNAEPPLTGERLKAFMAGIDQVFPAAVVIVEGGAEQ